MVKSENRHKYPLRNVLFSKTRSGTKKRSIRQKYTLKTKKGGVSPKEALEIVLKREKVPIPIPIEVSEYVLEYTPKSVNNTHINPFSERIFRYRYTSKRCK